MSLPSTSSTISTILISLVLVLLPLALSQFDKPKNANKFVDSMIAQVVNASNETILLADEQFLVVVDLLVFRPELDLQIFDGKMSGMKSLARSSDAILTYSEESGSPVFSISSSLILTNITVNSGATGKMRGFLGFELNMPDIVLDVLVEAVDISSVIEVDIGDFENIAPAVKDVEFRDVGNIAVEIIGLTPELDGLVSPITSLVINTVKRDLQNLVTPLLREMLEEQIKENAPSDVSELFG